MTFALAMSHARIDENGHRELALEWSFLVYSYSKAFFIADCNFLTDGSIFKYRDIVQISTI